MSERSLLVRGNGSTHGLALSLTPEQADWTYIGFDLLRLAAGHFNLKPARCDIYTLQSPEERVTFDVPKPTAVWWNQL